MEQVLPVLRGAVQDCQNQIEQKQISIQVDCDENLTAAMNAPLLEQAFTNLLDNAVKYSEPGGKIKISVCEKDGEFIITVQDWGCGIERTHHARLFERFYRVDKARSRKLGGTGLGLSIVKHIASIHNGKVFVESSPGKGSAFSIHLPRS
ncbi:MAG: GHKL domain-containing protein [Calditrichales bacterium]|nr:GHKL domain-containing protein [Calditrichales bacterium]